METTTRVWIVLFFIFFLAMAFLMIKLWLELNKFKKIEKFQRELTILRSQYFLNRMNQIYDLANKNKKYKRVFVYFYERYRRLFADELIDIADGFLAGLKLDRVEIDEWGEAKNSGDIFANFARLKNEIDMFNDDLNYISSWQNFSIEQLNFFELTISKSEEELAKAKLTMNFDDEQIEKGLSRLKKQINLIQKKIDADDFKGTYELLRTTASELPEFVEQLFLWLKLGTLFHKKLPEALEELKETLAANDESKSQTRQKKVMNELNRERSQIEGRLKNFDLKVAETKLIDLMDRIAATQWEVKNKEELKAVLAANLKLVQRNFDFAKKEFMAFKKFVSLFGDLVFFNKQKRIEFKQFTIVIQETQALIDELIIYEEDDREKMFLVEPIQKLKKIFTYTMQLINNYERFSSLFMTEKKRNQNLFFLILNLKSIFAAKNNFYLRALHQKEYEKTIAFFCQLKSRQQEEHQSITKFVNDFSQLNSMIDNLQTSVRNTVLLREIANLLLVKSNKFRFSNDFLKNKILNTEIAFAKNNYKEVIDTLLEVHEGKYSQWATLT